MRPPLPDITIDVNLRNPGQFFACCGLLELTSRLWPESEGWFSGDSSRAAFHVATGSGHNDPLSEIVNILSRPEDLVEIPADEGIDKIKADRQPVILLPFKLRLDWWLDSYGTGDKSELKVWAGQQTPKRNLNSLRVAWQTIRAQTSEGSPSALLRERAPTTGRFGFDPSASWEALDVGFSPDEQNLPVQTSPATEILAVVGLQRCRPTLVQDKRRRFSYWPWQTPIGIVTAPVAVIGAIGSRSGYEFPVVMRNAQYGSFGWSTPVRKKSEEQ
jgi:CRISPR-associated protein Csx14